MKNPGRYGFRARMRAVIKSAPLGYAEKAELFWILSRLGPYDAWDYYKRLVNQDKEAVNAQG